MKNKDKISNETLSQRARYIDFANQMMALKDEKPPRVIKRSK